MNQWRSTILSCVYVTLGWQAGWASAQDAPNQQPRPPSQVVFAGDRVNPNDTLFFTISQFEGHDDYLTSAGTGSASDLLNPQFRARGFFSRTDPSLSYSRRKNRLEFVSNGRATFDYYHNLNSPIRQPIRSYHGSASATAKFGRSSVGLSQSIDYLPYFLLQPVSTVPNIDVLPVISGSNIAFSPDLSVFNHPATTYNTAASWTAPLSRRATVDFNYGFQDGNFVAGWTDQKTQSAGAGLHLPVSRYGAVRVSYAYLRSTYRPPDLIKNRVESHDMEVGFSYARAVSRTRSVSFTVGSGAARLDNPVSSFPGNKRYSQVLGYSTLSCDVGRSWKAEVDFQRSLQLVQGLSQPFFGNAVVVSLYGTLGRRVSLLGSAHYSQGNIGVAAVANGYDTRSGSVRFRYALSRHFALTTEYLYNDYHFSQLAASALPVVVSRTLTRNVVRAGLTYGVSLLGQRP